MVIPKLSIITINLNNAEGLRKTIESVVSQTLSEFEYIVIDGGSTDESLDVIKQYEYKITYWVSEPDNGIYSAMNKGIKVAKGEYLQFLNSGDWLFSNNILENVFSLNRNEDFLYGNYYDKSSDIFVTPSILSAYYFYNSTISQQCVFYKGSLFSNCNIFNEENKVASDWEFFLKSFIFENKSYFKIELIIVGQQPGTSYDENLSQVERNALLIKYFPQMVIQDYNLLDELFNNPFFPFMEIFNHDKKMRKLVKRIIKIFLFISGRKNLIPKN